METPAPGELDAMADNLKNGTFTGPVDIRLQGCSIPGCRSLGRRPARALAAGSLRPEDHSPDGGGALPVALSVFWHASRHCFRTVGFAGGAAAVARRHGCELLPVPRPAGQLGGCGRRGRPGARASRPRRCCRQLRPSDRPATAGVRPGRTAHADQCRRSGPGDRRSESRAAGAGGGPEVRSRLLHRTAGERRRRGRPASATGRGLQAERNRLAPASGHRRTNRHPECRGDRVPGAAIVLNARQPGIRWYVLPIQGRKGGLEQTVGSRNRYFMPDAPALCAIAAVSMAPRPRRSPGLRLPVRG